jgi:hypothetical protein
VEIPAVDKTAEIQITDITGRVIETRNITDNQGEAVQFSLNNFATGMYFVKVKASGKNYVSKLIRN